MIDLDHATGEHRIETEIATATTAVKGLHRPHAESGGRDRETIATETDAIVQESAGVVLVEIGEGGVDRIAESGVGGVGHGTDDRVLEAGGIEFRQQT